MRNYLRKSAIGAVLLSVALVAAACGSGDGAGAKEGPTITVGSANFSENALLAEIYAQALENAGYRVQRNLNVGNREVYFAALESGDLSLVPEYVGTVTTFLGGSASSDSDATYQTLLGLLGDKGLTAASYASAQDKNGIVVRKDTADEFGLSKVSDLAQYNGQFIFGGPPECPNREFCLIGLQDVYGLQFADFKPLDVGGPLTVAALEGDEIQVALLFTSDGVIAAKGFVLLDDDKGLQPAENVTPVLRKDIVDAYGDDLIAVLDAVSAKMTTEELTALNKRVGFDGEDPDAVATDWLAANVG